MTYKVLTYFIIPLYANKVNCAILLVKSKEKGTLAHG